VHATLPNADRAVVLTFDDGPVPGHTTRILDILAEADAVATFYPLGVEARRHPELIRAIAEAGHEVGNHTDTHPHFNDAPPEVIEREMTDAQATLTRLLGQAPTTFRAPYFECTDVAAQVAARLGTAVIGNSVYPGDWKPEATADELFHAATHRTGSGDILLFHDRSAAMLDALPRILAELRRMGLTFATAADLVTRRRT